MQQRSDSGATEEQQQSDSSGSDWIMIQVDRRRQQRFDLPCLSYCFVLLLFSSVFSFAAGILSVLQSREKYFGTNCTLTLRIPPLRTRE